MTSIKSTDITRRQREIDLKLYDLFSNVSPEHYKSLDIDKIRSRAMDSAFVLTGELIIETNFSKKEKRIGRELFKECLYNELKNGGFDL